MDTTTTSAGEHVLTIDEVQLRYRIAGHGPLLVIHPPGWGIGATPYEATLKPLEDSFTIVYLWPRGAAGAPRPPASTALNVQTFVDDLDKLRSHLGVTEFALAGHSHSGLIALHYALQNPHRVSRLLLLSAQLIGVPADLAEPESPPSTPEPAEIAAAAEYLATMGGIDALFSLHSDAEATEFLRRILPLYFTDPRAMTPLAAALEPLTLPHHTLQTVTSTDESYPLDTATLSSLQVPTVIVAGRQDRFCPVAQARRLARTMPRATFLLYERSGHFPWLEEPDSFFQNVIAAMRGTAPGG